MVRNDCKTYENIMLAERTRRASRKKISIYFLKQKLWGIAMIAIGILMPLSNDGDATVSLITIPMGIRLLITKQKVMDFKD